MSGPGSNFASFSDSLLVRGHDDTFEPGLYSMEGGVTGCSGTVGRVPAAAGTGVYQFVQKGGSNNLRNYVVNECQLPALGNSVISPGMGGGMQFVPYAGAYVQTGGKKKRKNKKLKNTKRQNRKRKNTRRKKHHMKGGDNMFAVPSNYGGGVPYYGYDGTSDANAKLFAPGHAPVKVGMNSNCSTGGGKKPVWDIKKHTFTQNIGHLRKLIRNSHNNRKKSNKRKGLKKRRTHTFKKQRGGYSQFLSDVPYAASYSTGGINISPSESALANPPPYTRFINCPEN